MSFDFPILNYIQENFKSDFMDDLMTFFTRLGNAGLIWIILILILVIIPKTRRLGWTVALAVAMEALCNAAVKPVFARVRPCYINENVRMLIPRPADYSFPSGHSGASFAAASALFYRRRKDKNKLWLPSFILAALIAFSRLYLYVHYPTDVMAGVLLGILFGKLSDVLVRGMEVKVREKEPVRDAHADTESTVQDRK